MIGPFLLAVFPSALHEVTDDILQTLSCGETKAETYAAFLSSRFDLPPPAPKTVSSPSVWCQG